MGKFIDLTGRKFGRLTVIKDSGERNKHRRVLWLCKCDCGNYKSISGNDLNKCSSCGCKKRELLIEKNTTHNATKTRLYNTWQGMKKRCYNPKDKYYHIYGGRGITVCDEWKDNFQAFYDWAMSHGYQDDLSIDRIDPDGNYSPENCRWATAKEQANNKRNNHLIGYNGKKQTMIQWANELDIKYQTLAARINKYHWNIDRALNTP